MTHDVFLSYAAEDAHRAVQIVNGLEAEGFTVWWDRRIPTGVDWLRHIRDSIEGARVVVVLWSAHSIASKFVDEEASFSRERGNLTPAFLESVRPPFPFDRTEGAQLQNWSGDRTAVEWHALCDRIASISGKQRRALVTPDRNQLVRDPSQKNLSLLLAEPELNGAEVTRWKHKPCFTNRWACLGLEYTDAYPYKFDIILLTGDLGGKLGGGGSSGATGRLKFSEMPLGDVKAERFIVTLTFVVNVRGENFKYVAPLDKNGNLIRTIDLEVDRRFPSTSYGGTSLSRTGRTIAAAPSATPTPLWQLSHADIAGRATAGMILNCDEPGSLGYIILADPHPSIRQL